MIKGEPGTGKGFLAQCLHNGSSRAKEPYLVLNGATLAEQDAARALFGSEDAGGVHTGLLELAAEGTVALQNLAQAGPALTACILQALTERSFFRVGGVTPVRFRARFVTLAEGTRGFDIRDRLREIDCPVLVVGSADDRVLGAQPAEEIAGLLRDKPGLETYMYDGYGHAAYDTAPDFKERVLHFLMQEQTD